MKNKVLPVVIVLAAFLFSLYFVTLKPGKKRSFEGEITYSITIISRAKNPEFDAYLHNKYGREMIFTIDSDGNFRRDYTTSGKNGYEFFMYDAKTNTYHSKWRNSKTIHQNSCAKNSLTFVEEKRLAKEKIFNDSCQGYFISGKLPESNRIASLSYYYKRGKNYIDPKLYKDFNDFFFNKVIQKMRSPFYKLIMDLEVYQVIFEVTKIEKKRVAVTLEPNSTGQLNVTGKK